jgi:hypothetical protein
MNKNRFIALAMELFFEEVLMKKYEYIGLNYKGNWYYNNFYPISQKIHDDKS